MSERVERVTENRPLRRVPSVILLALATTAAAFPPAAGAASAAHTVTADAAPPAQPGPAGVQLTGSGSQLTFTVTTGSGEPDMDFVDFDLGTAPHPNGYYTLTNVSGPTNSGGAQDCHVAYSDVNCGTVGYDAPSGFSVSFSVSPSFPQNASNAIEIGYPDDWAEDISLCGPGSDTVTGYVFTYQGTVESSVTTGASCGGTVGVVGVRFASRSADSTPGTPGTPVVWDQPNATETVQQNGSSINCSSYSITSSQYDYLDCATPQPSGPPQQNWPVVFAAGGPLSVDSVVLYSPTELTSPELQGSVSGGGATLQLPSTSLTETAAGQGYTLTANGLSFSGTIPQSAVGKQNLTIDWTVTPSGGGQLTTQSTHAVYITAGRYAAPTLGPGGDLTTDTLPYLSVIDLGTTAAAGAGGSQERFARIWQRFESRSIAPMTLNPATGAATPASTTFQYYGDHYPDEVSALLANQTCGSFLSLLETRAGGHCGQWSWMMEQALAYQGIASEDVNVGFESGFYPGPPAWGYSARKYDYMLIDPWVFKHPTLSQNVNGGNPFVFGNRITVEGQGLSSNHASVVYNPRGTQVGQGPVARPVGLFDTGDHKIVYVPSEKAFFDPSYGNPQNSSGYATIKDWERASLAGFAVVLYVKPTAGGPVYIPLPHLASTAPCRKYRCYFAAVPGSDGQTPFAEVGSASGANGEVSATETCPALASANCDSIASVTAAAAGTASLSVLSRHRSRSVVLATRRTRLRPGRREVVTIRLNARGRRLLKRLGHLPVELTITQKYGSRRRLFRRRLTIRAARNRAVHRRRPHGAH